MTPHSSRNRRHCLLFPQSLSTVPLYADESDCGKSNFLFSASASVSILYRHAEDQRIRWPFSLYFISVPIGAFIKPRPV